MSSIGNSKENYLMLSRTGATMESRAVLDNDETRSPKSPLQRVMEMQQIPPAELTVTGLTRALSVVLYRHLDERLNQLTNDPGQLDGLAVMSEEDLADIERDPINLRTAKDADYDISLVETEPAGRRFSMEVRRGLGNGMDDFSVSRKIHFAFTALMEGVNLKRASQNVSRPQQEEKNHVARPATRSWKRRLSASNRLATVPVYDDDKLGETYNTDLKEVEFILRLLRVQDVIETNPDTLVEFWVSRGRNHTDMLDLFLYRVLRKQELDDVDGQHYHTSVKDLLQHGSKFDPESLEDEMRKRTKVVMMTKLGLLQRRADYIYGLAQTPLDKTRLHLVAWLSNYPQLAATNQTARNVFKTPIHSLDELFTAMQRIYEQSIEEIESLSVSLEKQIGGDPLKGVVTEEMWGDFGGVEYDRRIDDELDSYHRKLHFYRAAWGLGKYLFTTEKIDVAMKKWLQ